MSEIPDTVKRQAKRYLTGVEAVHYARRGEPQIGVAIIEHVVEAIIAKAIWEERQRCAKISEERLIVYQRLMSISNSCAENDSNRYDRMEHTAEAIEIIIGRISQAILSDKEES